MKLSHLIVGFAAFGRGISAAAISDPQDGALDTRSPESQNQDRSTSSEDLWKRKGGGGGGGRGGSSGSSGGKGGSSSTSSGGRGSSSSNTGGSTTTGSGVRPAYGGGTYYGGGAKQPYTSGSTSPTGIAPLVLGGAALGTIGFLGAYYAYGAYAYPYTHQYWYRNATNNKNETKPVTCVCDYYETCGCDDNGNQTYFNSVIGDGSYANLNKSLVTVADNDTTHESTIYIQGTLANGTTSSGGTEDPNAAGKNLVALAQTAGWWPVITTVIAIALL
ncbi:hypothetical protein F4781DRAFT_343416 [Annulohypoxylon bovei var. microspora]|nr:hypothetical protein F4781DRAFT_343416 [Annulohypoxylon bovei var. microspora]